MRRLSASSIAKKHLSHRYRRLLDRRWIAGLTLVLRLLDGERHVNRYTFYRYGADHALPSATLLVLANRQEAKAHAMRLMLEDAEATSLIIAEEGQNYQRMEWLDMGAPASSH